MARLSSLHFSKFFSPVPYRCVHQRFVGSCGEGRTLHGVLFLGYFSGIPYVDTLIAAVIAVV